MSTDTEFVAKGLVRSFSNSLMQDNGQPGEKSSSRTTLENALIERVDFEDSFAALLRGAISSQPTSLQIRSRYEELQKAVNDFQEIFAIVSKSNEQSKPLSWTSISDGIARMQKQHQEKTSKGFRGKTKERFHRLCEGINDHSGILKVLPQEYAGPVCASIEMIVKASVNHEQMGEDFSNALEEIDEVVQTTGRGLALYPNDPKLQDLVAQLCCRVLTFVAVPLKWYSEGGGKRLKTSFNENTSKVYEKHIEAVRRLAGFINSTVNLCTAEQARGTLQLLIQENSRLARQNIELKEERLRSKWQTDISRYFLFQQAEDESKRQLRENPQTRLSQMSMFICEPASNDLGKPIKEILDQQAVQFIANESGSRDMQRDQHHQEKTGPTTGFGVRSQPVTGKILHLRAEVEDASSNLNTFFDFDKVAPRALDNVHFAEVDVIQRLQSWTTESSSSILGVFGPFAASRDNAFRLLTFNYVRAAKAANIACVPYFCELPRTPSGPQRLPETIETSAMLCALIRQMVIHLPVKLPDHPQLNTQNFETLDGTLKTWDAALSLVSDLVTLSEAPVLLFAVYGFEILEHEATKKCLVAFVDTLKQLISSPKAEMLSPKIFKVLFVTSGSSHVLASSLDNQDVCDVNRGSAAMMPGAARKGRTPMSDLRFVQ